MQKGPEYFIEAARKVLEVLGNGAPVLRRASERGDLEIGGVESVDLSQTNEPVREGRHLSA